MAKRKLSQPQKAAKAKKVALAKAHLRQYRSSYRLARAKGLVKDRGKPSKFVPSKYMKTKLNKLNPYLGDDFAVLTPTTKKEKATVKLFKSAPSPNVPGVFNGKIIVKVIGGAEPSFNDGILRTLRHLRDGTFERIPMPIKGKDINGFREYIEKNEYLNDTLKHGDELFNFTIYGNKSHGSFGNLEALLDYLEMWYPTTQFAEDFLDVHFELFRSFNDWKPDSAEMTTGEVLGGLSSAEIKMREREAKRLTRYRERIKSDPVKRAKQKENLSAARMTSMSYARQRDREKAKRKVESPEDRQKRLEYMRKWRAKNKTKQ